MLVMARAGELPLFGVLPLGGIPTEVGTPNAPLTSATRHNENGWLGDAQS
jgi:hypothetical protein